MASSQDESPDRYTDPSITGLFAPETRPGGPGGKFVRSQLGQTAQKPGDHGGIFPYGVSVAKPSDFASPEFNRYRKIEKTSHTGLDGGWISYETLEIEVADVMAQSLRFKDNKDRNKG